MGAGALGSVLGALLSKKNDMLLITRGKHLLAIKEKGLRLRGISNGVYYLDVDSKYPGGFDIIIMTVKAYHTKTAANDIKKEYSGETVITFQNGIGILDELREFDVVPGMTTHGAYLVEPGTVIHAGYGDTYIGEINGEITDRVRKISQNFTESGLETKAVDDILKRRVIKAAVNSVINPLTAIMNVKNGEIISDTHLREIAKCVSQEVAEKLRNVGYIIDLFKEVEKVVMETSSNKSSMLQDVSKKRKTEIDYILKPFINGKCTRLLYHMIKHIDEQNEHK